MFDSSMFEGFKGETSTQYIPVPEADYLALCEKYEFRDVNGAPILELFWKIDAPGNDDAHEHSVKQSLWLDLDPSGRVDTRKGKNVPLGRVRAAVKQNDAKHAWTPDMLVGQAAKVTVRHRPDKEDPEKIYDYVKAVYAA